MKRISVCILTIGVLITGCEKKVWDEHYKNNPETVDQNIWEVIQADPEFSTFAEYVKQFRYDTLFDGSNTYTLFVPSNDAFNQFLDTGVVTKQLMEYSFSQHMIQSNQIKGKQKVQMLGEKFALVENMGNGLEFDGVELSFESPLYRNGKYYVIDQVALPKPNIYEYFEVNNPFFIEYVDLQDSIILDKELSRPIGFDEEGNTIYDTVSEVYNIFEEEFFPISEEFRHKTATIVFPLEEDYNAALTDMALSLGGKYSDHTDIPWTWQNDVLMPYLLERGVFEGMLEPEDFELRAGEDSIKLKNILGDSVVIEYVVADKALCSNGYVYNYTDFEVPDSLISGSVRFETERLLLKIGTNKYGWDEEKVKVITTGSFPPVKELVPTASNDSVLSVYFTGNFQGTFSLEFNVDNLWPREYLMVVNTKMYVGGIYDIYLNDELVMTMNWKEYEANRGIRWSVNGKDVYVPDQQGFNRFDAFVENKLDYGISKIRFEYTGPGNVLSNGFVIDYIEFFPVND